MKHTPACSSPQVSNANSSPDASSSTAASMQSRPVSSSSSSSSPFCDSEKAAVSSLEGTQSIKSLASQKQKLALQGKTSALTSGSSRAHTTPPTGSRDTSSSSLPSPSTASSSPRTWTGCTSAHATSIEQRSSWTRRKDFQ